MTKPLDSPAARLLAWEAGETPGPWEIILFPTNRCNLKCGICWQRWAEETFGKVDYDSEVSSERLLQLVDEAAAMDAREWCIVGGGEPMLRGALVMDLCERIRAHGMNGSIQSNGTRFTQEHFERLIRIGWDRLVISLDGPNPAINDAIRSAGAFDRAVNNLRLLRDLKQSAQSLLPQVSLSMVLTALNYRHLDDMVRLAGELGCESLNTITLVVQGARCREYEMSPEQRAELPGYIAQATRLAHEIGVSPQFYVPDNAMDDWPACAPIVSSNPNDIANAICFEPWLTLSILAEDGKGGPCSQFWARDCDNISALSLKDLWLGPYMQQVRQQILTHKNLPAYCSTCCSNIPGRAAAIREQLEQERRRRLSLPRRFWRHARQHGLRGALKRTKEFLIARRNAQGSR